MENIDVSQATLKRLPQYLRTIKENKDMDYISSTFIARKLNLNPIQVRKDLALVSKTDGKPGNGFEVNQIIEELEEFLGLNKVNNAIIVGAGKLGQALLNYQGFKNNLNVLMAFDTDKKKFDNKKIFNIDKMENLVKKMNIKIGIITVPKEKAQEICDLMIKSGIKAIWNFAPIHLNVPEDISIKNEDLSASILILMKDYNNKNNIMEKF